MGTAAYPTPRASGSLVISFGLVNIAVKYGPMLESSSGRLSGKFLDPATLTPAKQQYVNEQTGKKVEKVVGYPYGDTFVVLPEGEAQGLKSERDGRLELKAFVEPDTIDPLFFDKHQLVWPDKGNDGNYDVLCAVLEQSGKYLVGTTTFDSTRAVVLRYAHGCLMAHVCTYDALVRWGNVSLVSGARESRPEPDKALVDMANQVFGTLPDTFELSSVEDDYDTRLRAAVDAAAEGKALPKAPKAVETPAEDLMAALKATVAAAAEKEKPARKAKAKA